MKGDETELFAQPLLESRTGAYIEWLDNELTMTANNNINNDSLLVLLFAKINQQTIKLLMFLGVGKLFPLVRSVLRVHCILRIYLPLLQVMHEKYLCVEDSSGGLRRILVLIARCLF